MLKIRRPLGRLIFNMGIAIPGKTVFLIETAPSSWLVSVAMIFVLPSVARCINFWRWYQKTQRLWVDNTKLSLSWGFPTPVHIWYGKYILVCLVFAFFIAVVLQSMMCCKNCLHGKRNLNRVDKKNNLISSMGFPILTIYHLPIQLYSTDSNQEHMTYSVSVITGGFMSFSRCQVARILELSF